MSVVCLCGKLWVHHETDADIPLMAKTLGISHTTAKVLAHRGLRTRNSAIKFLNPLRKYMNSPSLLTDMERAVSVALSAIKSGKKITVYGDYDVDGVAGAVILTKAIEGLGGTASYYIPGRETEGYGLNKAAVEYLAGKGTALLITCDLGITAIEEIALARELGMEVIVIDHHETGDVLPNANAIIDHKRADCEYPFKFLCAAALCYKFAEELYSTYKPEKWAALDDELLVFAALATVCDIVKLTDENRVITVNGLAALNRGISNVGLNALLEERKLLGKKINVFDVGFIIGPCINAAGRLTTADLAVELFLLDEGGKDRAAELAQTLSDLNEERKKLTADAAERMFTAVESPDLAGEKIYVLYDPDMPESVAGIVAGRVKDRASHPVIMLTDGLEEGLVKGSARSVRGYNLFAELTKCKDLYERFGGHEMAAGLTMRKEYIDELRQRLNEGCALTEADFTKKLYIDAELSGSDITMKLANEISYLSPFGTGNYEPIFSVRNALCEAADRIGGDKKTLRFTFSLEGHKFRGIAFGKYDEFFALIESGLGTSAANAWAAGYKNCCPFYIDIAFSIEINEYQGLFNLQLKIVDFKNVV